MGKALVFWFTGLSGAGKSTVAEGAKERLEQSGIRVRVLDGDDIRTRMNHHLGFSEAEIKTNNALIVKLCEALRPECDVILVPIISPFRVSRRHARVQLGKGFFEVFINARIAVVSRRDTKGLYAKARCGEIDNLIGFSPGAAYEPPDSPDIMLDTDTGTPEQAVDRFSEFVHHHLAKSSA
jgi:bifunctional enzyme CysN/CysC